MPGLNAIDTALGVCLFFLLVSLLCSGLREAGETVLKARARDLERGLRMILDDKAGVGLMPNLLSHGLLSSLSDGDYDPSRLRKSWLGGGLHLPIGSSRSGFPSYIPARQFASALLDIVARGPSDQVYPANSLPLTAASLRTSVALLPSTKLQRVILAALDSGADDIGRTRAELEKWFDGSMDRVSGWYKRRTQVVLFCIGLVMAVLLNLDALTVTARLNSNPALRESVVSKAESLQSSSRPDSASVSDTKSDLEQIGYPIGWSSGKTGWPVPAPQASCPATAAPCNALALSFGTIIEMIVGWLITAFAVTLGAPFWFDLLNRFMIIRSTIKPTQKSPDEASADPQAVAPADDPATKNTDMPAQAQAAAGLPALPPPNWAQGDDLPAWRPGFVNDEEVAL